MIRGLFVTVCLLAAGCASSPDPEPEGAEPATDAEDRVSWVPRRLGENETCGGRNVQVVPAWDEAPYRGCYSRATVARYCGPDATLNTNDGMDSLLAFSICEAHSIHPTEGEVGDVGEFRPN